MGTFTLFLIAIVALGFALVNRSGIKRVNEDIDELRASQFELRTNLKSLRAEWNQKLTALHVDTLKLRGKIPENRIPYFITKDCISCGSCAPECPTQAITPGSIFEINPELCIACKKCADVCPVGACHPISKISDK